MTRVLDLIERHWRKAQRRWKKGSQLRDSGAANYDAFMHGEAVGQSKAYQYCAQWIKESLHKEDETVTDCHELEDELDRWRHTHFNGKRDDKLSGEYLERTSQLDLARHFAKWGAEHLKNKQK